MNIQEVIQTINQMQADGIIDRYAIGGAVGATFHLEPVSTLDVDIFVSFRTEPGSLLISPRPIHDYLTARGCAAEYLAAIALQTGRAKDKAQLLQFIESGILDAVTFQDILTRHSLTAQWAQFQRQFLSDNP